MNQFDSQLPNGVITASLTPLHQDLSINHEALVSHCHWLLGRGNDAICFMGTTGEANSFSVNERRNALDAVIDGGPAPEKLIVGTGCCALTDTIKLTQHAVQYGVGGILLLPPFYYKNVSDDGIVDFFRHLLDAVGEQGLKIYLYQFPQMTGVPYSLDLTNRLVEEFSDVVIGMKNSSGDLPAMLEILNQIPGFKLYAGTEAYLLDVLKAGGAGCISATTNATSELAAEVYRIWSNGEEAYEQQAELTNARKAFEGIPFASSLKYMFSKWQENSGWQNLRPPNVSLSADQEELVRERLSKIGLEA